MKFKNLNIDQTRLGLVLSVSFLILVLTITIFTNTNTFFVLDDRRVILFYQVFTFISCVFLLGSFIFLRKKYNLTVLDFVFAVYMLYAILICILKNRNTFYDPNIANLLSYLSVFIIVRNLIPLIGITKLILVLFLMGLFVAAVSLLQAASILSVISNQFMATGPFTNPAILAGYMILLMPTPLLLREFSSQTSLRMIWLALFVVFTIVVFISQSRAGVFSIMIFLLAIAWNKYFLHLQRIKNKILLLTPIVLFALLYTLYKIRPMSADGRILIWKISTTMTTESPVFGNGSGYFNHYYNLYQARYFSSGAGTHHEKMLAGEVHTSFNELLNLLISYGLIGTFLFLVILYVCCRIILKSAQPHLWYIGCGLMGLLCFSFFSYPLHIDAICIIVIIYLAIIAEHARPLQVKTIYIKTQILAYSGLLLFAVFRTVTFYNSYQNWQNIQEYVNYNTYKALTQYDALQSDFRNFVEFDYSFAAQLAELGYFRKAASMFEKILTRHHDIYIYSQLARCYQELDQFSKAENCLKTCIEIRPYLLNPQLLLFKLYLRSGNEKLASAQALKILSTPVKIKTAEAEDIRHEMRVYLLTSK